MLVANPDVVRPDGNASPMPGRHLDLMFTWPSKEAGAAISRAWRVLASYIRFEWAPEA